MYDLMVILLVLTILVHLTITVRSSTHFGTNKFSILFYNDNDQNQDYKIFAYNGTSVISTTHERGTNFQSQHIFTTLR
jgi:hypothetical protein